VSDKHYGLFRAICKDNADPTDKNRIRVSIPSLFGNDELTDWIPGCLPVVTNADHPDHLAHTAAQVAALLTNHSTTITTSSVNDGGTGSSSHSHTVTVNLAHTGNSNKLTHAHETSTDELDTNTATPEHTYHRAVPDINQVVWVMFEQGDINFPVWMGVY
jgi:hypothetical protein